MTNILIKKLAFSLVSLFFIFITACVPLQTQSEQLTLTDKEKQQIYAGLRLMSVQNEKHPVGIWNDNITLLAIFKIVQEKDLAHTNLLRNNNWNKAMWVE